MRRGIALLLLEAAIESQHFGCSGLGLREAGQEGIVNGDVEFPEELLVLPRDDVWGPTNSSAWTHSARCDSCQAPRRVALAYRGDYHRKAVLRGGDHQVAASGCSDFFHNSESHWQQLVNPLKAAGASVKTYFHSYRDTACPQRDERLVRELNPARYEFSNGHLPYVVDSYIKVLELVLQDEQDIDAIVLTRFDLRYRAPITMLNVHWNVTNVAHREGEKSWSSQRKLSDLFYVLPIGHARALMHALKDSANHHKPTGAGHWLYHAFVSEMGENAVHLIDEEFSPSTSSPSETSTFLGVSRGCGTDFDECPAQ